MSYSSEVLADTPLAYWRLDEASGNFADSSGNGFTAAAFGTAYTYQQTAAVGEGFSITNASDARAGTDLPDFTDANVWTLEAWIKTSNDGSSFAEGMGIIEKGVASSVIRVGPSPAGVIYLVKSSIANDGYSTITVADDAWHHIVARRTGGVSSIWIDGVDRTGTMANPTYANNTNSSGFGAQWLAGPASPKTDSYFIGSLDDIAIYDHALSDARIQAHFAAAASTTRIRTPKRLVGPTLVTNSPVTGYTVPATYITRMRHVHISNPSGSPVDMTLSIGTDAAATRLLDGKPIAADSVYEMACDEALAAGEIVQMFASSTNVLTITISGEEWVPA